MPESTPPSGELTFLFTDVEGSSALWEQDSDSMGAALAEHDRRLASAVAEHGGYVFTTAGDSFAVAFDNPSSAVAATVLAQQRLSDPAPGPEIRVRMGLHTGTAIERDGDYFGPVLNRCARLMSTGHGGQVLISGTTAALVRGHLGHDLDLIDLGEHRLKDLSFPEQIYQLAHPDLATEFAPLRTADPLSTSLPERLTSFVGRQRELDEITELVADARLITLAGPGGSGKTRIALRTAADHIASFPGGVGFVELAPITDPELVDDTVATAFGAQESPQVPLVDAIAAKIGGRRLLLVIDNCEHVLTAAAEHVARLLALCPGLTVLATSQAPLGIAGEIVYRVPSLEVPAPTADVPTARSFDAVQLFTDRAMLTKPSFEMTPGNVKPVVAICRLVDGIPLALELAAARLAILTPGQIADRLDQRFRLLRGGPRTADARHQTLEATIDWSHELLADDEQALFRRCGVFTGTFGIEAVQHVGAVDPIDEYDALDLLSALVHKSLVVAEDVGNVTRYRLLESMRHYAQGQLTDHNETDVTSRRHLAHFADVAEALQQQYRDDQLALALDGLRIDRDNMRAALEFGLSSGHPVESGRIIGAIGYLWYTDGAFHEGIDWCARLFALEPDLPPALMAAALHTYGTVLGSWSDPNAGGEYLEREVALRRDLDDPVRLAAALNNLGNMWNDAGRNEEAEAALLEAVDLYRGAGEPASLSLAALGYGRMHTGDYDRAIEFYEEALAEARSTGNAFNIAVAATPMGQCTAHMRQFEAARLLLEEGRRGFSELGVTPGVRDAELNLALVDRAQGNLSDAAQGFLTFLDDPDSHWYLAARYWVFQYAASMLDDAALAALVLGAVDAYYRSVKEVQQVSVRRDFESTQSRLRNALGDEDYAEHFLAGAGRTSGSILAAVSEALTTFTTVGAERST